MVAYVGLSQVHGSEVMKEKFQEMESNSIRAGSLIEVAFDDGRILKLRLDEERDFEQEDNEHQQISIKSPIGKALIGHTVGDEVTFRTPSGADVVIMVTDVRIL
jgi:transcription elongation GreA/GreB family factor